AERRRPLERVLPLVLDAAGAEYADRLAETVAVVEAAGGRRAAGTGGWPERSDVEQRLPSAVDVIDAGEQRERPEPVADGAADVLGWQGGVGAVLAVV